MPFTPKAEGLHGEILSNINDDRELQEGGLAKYYKGKYEGKEGVLGLGGERIVIDDGDEAVAIKYSGDKYSAITTFYAQRILHVLYPENFPRFKAVYYLDEQKVDVEFRDKIEYEVEYGIEDVIEIEEIGSELHGMGIHITTPIGGFGGEWLYTDQINTGLVVDKRGNKQEVFLDAVRHSALGAGSWEYPKIVDSMESRGHTDADIKKVLKASLRVSTIAKEKLHLIETDDEETMNPSCPEANILTDEQVRYINGVLEKLDEK